MAARVKTPLVCPGCQLHRDAWLALGKGKAWHQHVRACAHFATQSPEQRTARALRADRTQGRASRSAAAKRGYAAMSDHRKVVRAKRIAAALRKHKRTAAHCAALSRVGRSRRSAFRRRRIMNYIMVGDNGRIKTGITKNLKRRNRQFSSGNYPPARGNIVFAVRTAATGVIEAFTHARLGVLYGPGFRLGQDNRQLPLAELDVLARHGRLSSRLGETSAAGWSFYEVKEVLLRTALEVDGVEPVEVDVAAALA